MLVFIFPFLDMDVVRDGVEYCHSPSKCTVIAREKENNEKYVPLKYIIKNVIKVGTGNVVHWYSACLACVRPWVQSSA